VLAVGCSGSRRTAEYADVSGRVLYKGKPVTGGRVGFVAVQGSFASTGTIDEQGNYKINAPVGEVRISVDNEMLKSAPPEAARRGAGRPDAGDPNPIKGKYIQLPDKYTDPQKSGLTWTVPKGGGTYDIELPD
jgi:hypothetical protein